jgi:hypothetical protein
MLLVVLGFTVRSRRWRLGRATWCGRNGPVALVALAVPLILADTLRHVLLDTGVWPGCIALNDGSCAWWSASMYRAGEADAVQDENLTHLSTIGIIFTIVFTYSGFGLLAGGSLMNAEIGKKLSLIRAQWTLLRSARPAAVAAAAAAAAASDAQYVSITE